MFEDLFQNAAPRKELAPLDKDTQGLIKDELSSDGRTEGQIVDRQFQGVNMNPRPVQSSGGYGDAIAEKYNRIAGVDIGHLRQAASQEAVGMRTDNIQRAAQLVVGQQRAMFGAMAAAQQAEMAVKAARSKTMGNLLNIGGSMAGYGAGGGFSSQQDQPPPQQSPSAGYTMPEMGSSARGTMNNARQYNLGTGFGNYGQGNGGQ